MPSPARRPTLNPQIAAVHEFAIGTEPTIQNVRAEVWLQWQTGPRTEVRQGPTLTLAV